MNDSVVPVSVVSGFILLLLSSKRIRTRMAALIAWLVGSITGSRGEEEQSEKNKQSATTSKSKSKTDIKQNKNKVRQRARKANEDPTFNTKLSTPIEDIIEETLSEEKTDTQPSTSQTNSDTSITEKPIGKSKKKKRGVKKDNVKNKSDDEEDVGFSFFKAKSTQPNTSETKQKPGKPLETQTSVEIPVADDVGYSFFPTKEKSRKGKGKSLLDKPNSGEALTAVIAQGIAKKSDSSKPSIIDHYKTQSSRKAYNTPLHTIDNSQSFVFVSKVETSVTKTEVKESKKVSSHISYANVVTNNIPEHTDVEEQNSQQVKTNETVEVKEELSKEVSSSIEVLSQCSEDPDTHIEQAEEISEDTFKTFHNNEELPNIENITDIRVCKESLAESEHVNVENKLILEGSIEVIEKSIVSSVVDKQKNKDADSHFEKNILSSVLNSVNQSEDLIKDNYVTNHFEHTQSDKIETKQVVEENKGNLQTNVFETFVNDNEELNDQVLNNIIEQVIHSEERNIVSDSIAQEDIKALLVEESRDHLEEKSSSQENVSDFTEVIEQLDENLVNNLTAKSSELAQEEYSSQLQYNQEPEEEAKVDLASKPEHNYSNIEESISDFQEAFKETPKDFVNVPILTGESHVQEDNLSSSDDKFISEIVEDFIRAELTQELNLEPNLFEQQEVQEILAVEQIHQHQESKPIPVEEKPFIKKVAYITTDNQPVDNQTDKINQDLDDQIIDYLSNKNQIKSLENQVNSVEQQLPESGASDSQIIQSNQDNQNLSGVLDSNFQVWENSVTEVTNVEEQIEENTLNQNKTEILGDNITKEAKFKDTSVEDILIEENEVEDRTVDQVKTEILVEKIADETKDISSKFKDSLIEENLFVENTVTQSEPEILEEEEVVVEEINVSDYNIGDSQIKENQTEESNISQHQPEEEKVVEKINVCEYNIGNSQTEESSVSQHQLEEEKIVGVEINVNEYNIGDSQIEECQTKEISISQCQPEEEKVVGETKESENNSESILTEENSINKNQLELFERKTFEETKISDYHIEDNLINSNQVDEKIVISHSQTEVLDEKFIDSDFIKSEKIQTTIESIQVHTSHQEVSVETHQSSIDNDIEESPFAKMTQIRILTLNDKEHQESTIYRIEKNFVLQFRLGPSLLGRKIKLYCNYPKETNGILKEFDRGTYQLVGWCQDEGCKNADDTASFAQIVARIAGSFHYYFIYENEDTEERQGSGYFLVDPVLKYGNDETLPLDCIQCQTVLAKQMGPFSTWENKLRVAKESGYNVVHFTPVQELGISKSCYSLSEQLKLNPMFDEENGNKPTFEDVEKLTNKMRKEWKVLSICDIVLNHTANESEWIKEHPEATYNCVNCPYLRPAYLLDAAFHHFSMDVKKGNYEDKGIPAEVSTEEHLNAILYHFKSSVLEPLKLQELFLVDVNKYLEEFLTLARKTPPIPENSQDSLGEIKVIQDPKFKRLKSTVDIDLALKIFNVYRLDCFDEESRVKRCAEDLKIKLESLNEVIIKEVTEDLNVAVNNIIAGIRYFRVQADGPKFKDITLNHPLVHRYFTDYGSPKSLTEYEEIMYSENGKFLMAHNGWVMNSDPLKNFAGPGTKTYIKRELIAWGDSVKLRYGDKPEDSPYLWDYMRKYVEQTAKIFDGVRLDNCHSTPIPVAEYLLDAARKIRPDLYVVAELFTNSDLTDNIFVNRLGITSLIREAMSAWDSHEEGRLVYRYGGVPVGSFYQPSVRPLVPMVAHALFLDLTHDNPSPVEKRSVFDLLPSTALVNMACCASGTTRGYDELVPHHIHVVDETRQYTEWSDDESLTVGNVKYVNDKFGIIAAKKALNDLHFKLGKEGYNQVYVDQMDPDIVAVTRHNPETHISYVLVAFTAFGHPDINAGTYQRGIKPLRVEGVLDEIVLEASFSHIDAKSGGSGFTKFESFTKDSTWINGLSEYQVSLKQHIQVNQSDILEEVNSGTVNVFQLNFKNFKPGSIAVVRVSLPEDVKESVSKVRSLISSFSAKKDTELKQIISRLSLSDLNRALYRCGQEERDEGNGFDVYNIPNFSPTVYCGLQGFMSLLAHIRPSNDLGHPFCANLRDGNWAIEYIWKRLKVDEGTKQLGQWIEENTKPLHSIPRYLVPCYFDVIVTGIYINLLEQSFNLMSDFVKHGSTFVRSLSLGSLQFAGYVRSADLPVLSPNLAPPKPPTRKNNNGETVQACVTISAGLPHFSVGYMRNWGRDTFIALRGLLILTGRFEEARQHILGYAACLRHGLIPNLLDGGRNSRFNCRDAIWWWLYCIKSYCEDTPNGTTILSDKVSRLFPTDDSSAQPAGAVDQPLHDVIQEALKVHFQGLKFRERNAGRQIDEQMTDAGFNNQIGIHPETGFVFGGNQWNCGTWMDKMGSSEKAGNKGKPATPRDGSAVELVGLSKASISWLWKLNQEEKYPYDGVERTHKNGAITKWTFKDWAEKIQENFEKNFWIGLKPSSDESRPDLINKKNIYKDSFGASQPWTDYQLKPNFPISMVAAPEMFDPQHAWVALEQAEKYLLGPLGMKTLDPEDWNYRGDYDNSNDSNDFNVAQGFNYHQGPEWVWPLGFFLRAKLIFAAQNGMLKETLASTKVILSKHFTELQTSPWRGLPELTNSNGSYCRDSSRTQAWSMSCILEVLHDLQQIESKQIIVN